MVILKISGVYTTKPDMLWPDIGLIYSLLTAIIHRLQYVFQGRNPILTIVSPLNLNAFSLKFRV